ncbi:MAG: hypothetical protein LQ351_005116 [Letrouitia transgressa]|nr:MAG: hypothetical protein LQ351_005116 [Letrouitia transgressa]
MGKLLAKVKTAFLTETPSVDDGLFGTPDSLPSSKILDLSPSSSSSTRAPACALSPVSTSGTTRTPSPAFGPFGPRSTYEDYESQLFGVPEGYSLKDHAQVSGAVDYDWSFSPSHLPGQRQVSTPAIISNQNLFPSADISPRPPTVRDAVPVAFSPLNISKQRALQNQDKNRRLAGHSSLPFNSATERHFSTPNSTPHIPVAQSTRLRPSSLGSLNTQRQSAVSSAAQPDLRDRPALKTCNICLDPHPATEFPTMPITSTCAHPIDDTCKSCLQQHLATQIANRGGGVLTCICNQPLSFQDVQQHATPADFVRYDERAAIGTIERCAHFVWCPHTGCSGGQIHEAGDAAPIVTCAACFRRFCYTHRVVWHTGVTCTQYDALTPAERVEAIERAEMLANAASSPNSAANSRSPQMLNVIEERNRQRRMAEEAKRQRRVAEERASRNFIRASGAKQCPGCNIDTQKSDGCRCGFRGIWTSVVESVVPLQMRKAA